MHPGLVDLARTAATVTDAQTLLRVALPVLQETWGAETVAVLGPDGDSEGARTVVLDHVGRHVATDDRHTWRAQGLELEVHDAAGVDLVLLRRASSTPVARPDGHALAVATLVSGLTRLRATSALGVLQRRVEEGQRLVGMGDWDWHVARDQVRWSDEVFRIFGLEPGVVTPTYAAFLAAVHPDDREQVQACHRELFETGRPFAVVGRVVRPDGEVRHVSSRGELVTRADGTPVRVRGTSLDVTELVTAQQEREALSTRLGDARRRRQQALEINDNVVQGLATASYALDADREPEVAAYLRHALAAARSMMNDLLEPLVGEDLTPGDLVRSQPARVSTRSSAPVVAQPAPATRPTERRVLLVDDSEDLRALTRTFLDRAPGLSVVGEAADGLAGVELATSLQPDLVVLDLAMPRMDGLQALPLIKAAVPGVRVVVFSGFAEASLTEQAMAAGADAYATKGSSMRELVAVVTATLERVGS